MSEKIDSALLAEARTFFATGASRDVAFRRRSLRRLLEVVKEREDSVLAALADDLGKSAFESYECEVGLLYEEIRLHIRNLKRWTKIRRVSSPLNNFPSRSWIRPEPYGVSLILSPWNYPFQLAMLPLVGAVAAGNCAVLKPSELTPKTAAVIADIIAAAFDPGHVAAVLGGPEVSKGLLEQNFDYIFFTGGPSVGKLVMAAAAKNLTPVTLELGGKSPCVIDGSGNMALTARRVAWAKFLNCGQTCVAPDFVMIHHSAKDEFIAKMDDAIRQMFGDDPKTSSDYPRIVNERHFDRVTAMLEGVEPVIGGNGERSMRYLAPTVVDSPPVDSALTRDEIFGPILPVVTYERFDEVVDFINLRPKPLACYYYGTNRAAMRRLETETSSGALVFNDAISHCINPKLPFGGVGMSGMGSCHGEFSFATFSHFKAVMAKGRWFDLPFRYAPYKGKIGLLKTLVR